jgi:phage-related protein
MWTHLTNAWNKFVTWCTNLATKAKEGAKKAVEAIKNGFTNLPGNMVSIGTNVVKGIWNGIGNTAQWLFDKIKGFKDQVLNKFKSFFGIHSPSTLFRDQVGVFMAQGIGEGFTDEMSSVSKQMNKAMATVGLGDMFELSPTLNRTMSSSSNVNVQVINNMETDLLGNLVNNIKTYSNGAKNDYNYGMSY